MGKRKKDGLKERGWGWQEGIKQERRKKRTNLPLGETDFFWMETITTHSDRINPFCPAHYSSHSVYLDSKGRRKKRRKRRSTEMKMN